MKHLTAENINLQEFQRNEDALRKVGLHPVQIWVQDTQRPGFEEECRRQCELIKQADMEYGDLQQFMDEALKDIDSWTV
ncbi:antitoxin MazE family protein [Bartonella ancashensis]|uniref:Antitoxin MazE n=1 Tax=Bartonella ancashensis TaxID=1318743 RepID=A0A0M4LHC4_9HYPH|nr:antitoxin MazE family protein [Bartonella ancashensis]ALE02893.1 hypothetical protein PU02_0079 [Bartonella ancashensis]